MEEPFGVNLGELKRLATRRFGNLSGAESKLLDAASGGEVAHCGPSSEYGDPLNDPAKGDGWEADRAVRSELIRWLCLKKEAASYVDARGVNLFGAKVIGKLDLSHASIPFPVCFERCRIVDEAELTSVKIPDLGFLGSRTQGLLLENAEIKGNLIIKETVVEGEVRVLAAQIGSTLNCHGSTFRNPARNCQPAPDQGCGRALLGDRMRVSGGVFLRNKFTAYGEVALNGASIGGDLSFRGSTLNNLQREALTAEKATVDGNVFFYDDFAAYGAINLSDAKIGGSVNCLGGIFDKVVLERTVIRNAFVWSQLDKADVAQLDLRNAVVGSLADDEKSWPKKGNLRLDGFNYKRITGTPLSDIFGEEESEEALRLVEKRLGLQFRVDSPIDAATRLRWLDRDTDFKPQPYRQLADVLSEMGDEEGAKQVRFEMERRMRAGQRKQLPAVEQPFAFVGDKMIELTIGYGVYPLHALCWSAGLCLVGWAIHRRANVLGAMAPAEKEVYREYHEKGEVPGGYPPFSPFVYSLENCIPFLKLGQDARWEADPSPIPRPIHCDFKSRFRWLEAARNVLLSNPPLKWLIDTADFVARRPAWLRRLRWAMIIAGWLLATFFVAGLTGLVKTH